MKLSEIASGWKNFIESSPEHQQMINYRLNVCDGCPMKEQMSPIGKMLVQAINDQASIYRCSKCKCALASKTASPESQCPLSYWGKWTSPSQSYY